MWILVLFTSLQELSIRRSPHFKERMQMSPCHWKFEACSVQNQNMLVWSQSFPPHHHQLQKGSQARARTGCCFHLGPSAASPPSSSGRKNGIGGVGRDGGFIWRPWNDGSSSPSSSRSSSSSTAPTEHPTTFRATGELSKEGMKLFVPQLS